MNTKFKVGDVVVVTNAKTRFGTRRGTFESDRKSGDVFTIGHVSVNSKGGEPCYWDENGTSGRFNGEAEEDLELLIIHDSPLYKALS